MAKSTNKTTGKTGATSGTSNDTAKAAQSAGQESAATGMSALGGAMGLGTGQGAIEALKQDHRRVESLFSQFESASDGHRKEELVAMICTELNIHTRLEEEIFYPACQEEIDDEDLMDEAQVEHDAAKFLIADLLQGSCDDAYYDAKVKALKEQIRHHVAEEEKAGEGVFAKAQAHGVDTPQLAAELAERKQELQRRGTRLQPTRAVSFDIDLRDMIGNGGGAAAEMTSVAIAKAAAAVGKANSAGWGWSAGATATKAVSGPGAGAGSADRKEGQAADGARGTSGMSAAADPVRTIGAALPRPGVIATRIGNATSVVRNRAAAAATAAGTAIRRAMRGRRDAAGKSRTMTVAVATGAAGARLRVPSGNGPLALGVGGLFHGAPFAKVPHRVGRSGPPRAPGQRSATSPGRRGCAARGA